MSGVTKELRFHICCYDVIFLMYVELNMIYICVQVKLSAISLGVMPHTLTRGKPELLSVFDCS